MYHIRRYADHTCRLPPKGSESCLAKQSPLSGYLERLQRISRKFILLDKQHPLVKYYCRSGAAVIQERKRHVFNFPWFVIHPLSKFSFYVDIISAIFWSFCFIADPFLAAFWSGIDRFVVLDVITSLVNAALLLLCFTRYIIGFFVVKTKEIVLNPKSIAYSYLTKYFFVDFVGSFTFRPFLIIFNPECDEIYYNLMYVIRLVKLARVYSCYKRSKLISLYFNVSERVHIVSFLALLTLLLLHWLTCFLFIYSKIAYYLMGYIMESILNHFKISDNYSLTPWYQRYVRGVHLISTQLCGSRGNVDESYQASEQLYLSFITIFGQIYYIVCFVLIYLTFKSRASTDTCYEEFLLGVHEFMKSKKLPPQLKQRVCVYYENRFQRKYFREASLISLLSEHLQHEVWLHSCQRLIDQVQFFKVLPKTVVGIILAHLKQEVYLPHDVILKADAPYVNMYFISWGTVAVYTKEQSEVDHLVDGMHFGMPPINRLRLSSANYTYVAVEVTECFRWDKEGYNKCFMIYNEIADILDKIHLKIIADFQEKEDAQKKLRTHNILSDLQQGKIIETGKKRSKYFPEK
ncbi:potassium/sodium hyperpolarization-activated cyclic nucleotide-gated channel 4-like [Onthophagus taurus]|uniref:potassium/sodium hyperpolarization-activated cyclic nucleotide-gated channel 4-like n=1 Tax=Onthophagus taurus TaxID=166361 RepID=UPI000C20E4EA|nr:potassium/sodium hyperpolarization-activated cyclic nucleotide-gated channel 4-like [Onthophagus taurus]